MLTKLCARCGRIMSLGSTYCSSCKEKMESRHSCYDRSIRDKQARAFYTSPTWRRLREKAMLRSGGMCERCADRGVIRPADEVHHKVPIGTDWGRRLEEDNLICLCHACHMAAHRELERARRHRGM